MSVLFWDGFDNPDNPNWTKWGWGAPTFLEDGGRDGGSVVMTDTWGAIRLDARSPSWGAGFTVGVTIRPIGVENRWGIFMFGARTESVYVNCCGLCCQNGHLTWCIGSGDLYGGYLAQGAHIGLGAIVRAGCWNNVEMHVHGGYITAWVNGLYIPPVWVNFFAYDGFPLGKVWLGARTQWQRTDTSARYFEDFYLAETPEDDSQVGDLTVNSYFPVSDGTHTDWDTKTGVDHYAMIDENPDDEDTSYVVSPEADGVGNMDTYLFGITEHSGTPIDVVLHWRARKTKIGPRTMRAVVRLGTTEIYSDPFHVYGWWPLEDYQTYLRGEEWFTFQLDPNGDPWTWENLEVCEFGQEIYT